MFNDRDYALVTPPASEPVSLTDVKSFLRIDGTDDDAVLTILISSARRMAEEFTKRAFITQTWRLVMDRFTDGESVAPAGYHIAPTPFLVDGSQGFELIRRPIQSVTSIKTTDTSDQQTTVPATTYGLNATTGEVYLKDGASWPTGLRKHGAVEVTYVAGWPNAAAVPEPIKQGILQHVAASYSSKVCAEIPAGAMALYSPFRLAEAFGAF